MSVAPAVLVVSILASSPAVADADRFVEEPRVAPIFSKPGGQTYGRWAAEWWQWALGVPAVKNPLVDETGADCDERQVDDTWFLAGSSPPAPVVVERQCNIPERRALFFPLVSNFFGAFLNDPPETRTEEFVRGAAACTSPVELFAEIDGFEIRRLERFFTGSSGSQSPFFNVQLPPGNLFGVDESVVPELVLSPSAEQGYYLFVRPLPPGEHVLHWTATGCTDRPQDITYRLTIVPAENDIADEHDHAEGRVGSLRLLGKTGMRMEAE
jgi:hypothetical protein